MNSRAILMILFFAQGVVSAGADASESLKTGHEAYRRNNPAAAADIYEGLLKIAPDDPALHYNLANCRYRQQDWAGAILHYEKALRFRPWWADAAFNLKLARSRILDREEDVLPNPFLAAGKWILARCSVNAWILLGLLGLTSVCLVVALPVVPWVPDWKSRLTKIRIPVLILGLLFSAIGIFQAVSFETIRSAVVMEEEVSVYSGPQADFTLLFKVHKGTTVRLLSIEGDWSEVRLSTGYSGWIRTRDITKI